jgi:predicted CopG family antitoxin
MKRLEIRIPDELWEEIWKIHTETRKSFQKIIMGLIEKGLDKKNN